MSATLAPAEAAPAPMVGPGEVAHAMGVSRQTVLTWVRDGRLTRVVKLGKTIKFPRAVLDDILSGRLRVD